MATGTDAGTVSISAYSHVNLQVLDVDRAVGFYTEVLGFEAIPRPDAPGFARGAWLQHGTAQVHLSATERMPERTGRPHLAFLVPANAFTTTCDTLAARGVTWLVRPVSREVFDETVWTAFLEDPDGNLVELTTAGPR
jgi:catechol 2,3-dioxygenase